MTKIMITNNTDGNHSVEDWALTSAETLCDISGLDGQRQMAARRLQAEFVEHLTKLHTMVQQSERDRLATDPRHITTHRGDEFTPVSRATITKLADIAAGTEWAGHYARPEVQNTMHDELMRHLLTSVHVERLSHSDRHPDDEYARQYKLHHNAV